MPEGLVFLSEEEAKQQGGEYPVLPEDEYRMRIVGYEEKPNMESKFGDPRDIVIFKLKPLSFADGSELEDTEGEPWNEAAHINAFIEPKRRGFGPAGPSKARKFFAAAMGVMPSERFELESYDDLVGKELIVALNVKNGYNNPTDYRAAERQRRRRGAAPTPAPAPVVDDEDDLPF